MIRPYFLSRRQQQAGDHFGAKRAYNKNPDLRISRPGRALSGGYYRIGLIAFATIGCAALVACGSETGNETSSNDAASRDISSVISADPVVSAEDAGRGTTTASAAQPEAEGRLLAGNGGSDGAPPQEVDIEASGDTPGLSVARTASLELPGSIEARISAVKSTDKPSTGDMVLGEPGAPLTIVEYASLTCPYCATFHGGIVPMIKAEFVETGKAILVFRDFPTAPAQLSYAGAVLARCTADRGGVEGYFAILESLFKNQESWAFGETPKKSLLKIMAQAGMTEDDFATCLGRQDIIEAMNDMIREATETFDVDATPTVFVNGKKTRHATVEQYREALNAAYREAVPTAEGEGAPD